MVFQFAHFLYCQWPIPTLWTCYRWHVANQIKLIEILLQVLHRFKKSLKRVAIFLIILTWQRFLSWWLLNFILLFELEGFFIYDL